MCPCPIKVGVSSVFVLYVEENIQAVVFGSASFAPH